MKKKVLFLTTQFNHGGVERSLVEACKALDPQKYDITIFLRYNKTELIYLLPDYVRVIIDIDGPYYRYPKSVLLQLLKKTCKIIKRTDLENEYSFKLSEYIQNKKIQNPQK